MDLVDRVPMRWPCGPLEVEQGRRRGFAADEEQALRAWSEPRALDLLAGTPVDVLVVTWAAGVPGDEAHQQALAPLLAAARGRGLSVVGQVAPGAGLRRAAAAARAAGLAALATESAEPLEGGEVLRFRKRGRADLGASGFLGDADAVWPGMRPLAPRGDVDAVSGATSRPWIDSNAWYVRLAHALLEPRAVWLAFDPPPGPSPAADAYVQAVADTEACGARWVVSLDPALRLGLAEGRPAARDAWARIGRGLAFFAGHRGWAAWSPVGQIGVVSDFSGGNEFLAFEVLNLLARRSSLYRVLPKETARAASFEGLDGVVYVDEAPPDRDLTRALYAFAEAGGTLVTPPGWEARGGPAEDLAVPRFRVGRLGRGRVAVAREAFSDPDLLAEDAGLLTSHRHDRVRVFNLGFGHFHHAASPDGRSGVLHVLTFPMPYRRGTLTAWFRRPWASARLFTVDAASAEALPRVPAEPGAEFPFPATSPYCALEVSAGPERRT